MGTGNQPRVHYDAVRKESTMGVVTTLPFRVRSLNAREHLQVKARRVARERGVTRLAMSAPCAQYRARPPEQLTITLTRVGPRRMDDDNSCGALKAIRDGVADALGIDDGDPRLTWEYRQEKGPFGVRVELRSSSCVPADSG